VYLSEKSSPQAEAEFKKVLAQAQVKVPMRLGGTNVVQGRKILQNSGLTFTVASGMLDAAQQVANLVH
jgi:succinyl-CoA synthetase beta subunit